MDKHYLYDDVKNLKYWVHAILPLVYDDSLSYYEVLAKVSAKMNEVIEQLNKNSEQIDKVTEFTVTSIENLTQAFNNFQAAMLERQDNFEKKLLKDVADWEEQLMADIDEWEKQLKSEIDEWETTLKNEINTWETNFTETYNTWKNQLESDIAEWERQLKADNDKWKADTTDELNTWKSDTESALNEWKNETMQSLETWKSNTESDINSWKQEAESDIASWKEQAEQGLDTWKQQAQADITKWENDFQSKYDSWKSEFESTYNSWQSAFEEKYNTWQSTFEASYTKWKNGVDSDLAAWKTQAEKDIQTWESNTENSLNTWKENFQGEQANWEADVQHDIEQKFEQLSEVYVAKADVVQTTGQSTTQVMSQKAVSDSIENVKSLVDEDYVHKTDVVQATGQSTTQVMSQKAVTDELGKKANNTDVTNLSNRVDNISSELAGDYVAKSDIVSEWGNNTDKVVSQFMNKYSLSYKGYITTGKLSDIKEEGVYRIENVSISDYPPYNYAGALINIVNWNAAGNYTNHTPYVIIQIVYLYDATNYKLLIRSIYASNDNVVESGGWANVLFDNNVVQTTGQNTAQVMSQKAVTDELGKKASAVTIDDNTVIPTISGVNTYVNQSALFNNIPKSYNSGILYFHYPFNNLFGAELIIPLNDGSEKGVWYDIIKNGIRQQAIKLADQPDLDKANSAITSLQNTLSTTQQQVNGLSAYSLKAMTTAPTSSTELSNTRNFATYLLSYEQFRTQENMPYVINRIQDDLSPCVFAFTCIPLAGGQNNMCEQTLTIYTPVSSNSVPKIFAMFKRYVQSINAGRPIAAESMWQRIDNNVLQVTPPSTNIAILTALGNGVFSLSPQVYNGLLISDKPKSLQEYSVGGKIIVENVCLSHKISMEVEEWVYEQRLSTSTDSTKWTRTVTFDGERYTTNTSWYKINMTAD